MTTALVTGATAGIGNAFARALAARGHDLVLVARDQDRLAEVAERIRNRDGVAVEVLAADLSERDQIEQVAERLRDGSGPVDILVNNAGFGIGGPFAGGDLAGEETMLTVLVRAVLVLSHAAAAEMASRGGGQIVNVSSVASFTTGGTYSAAKAWVTTFSVSLAGELAGSGVQVQALCPGFVRTEFHQRMGARGPVAPSWAFLDADRLVADCLRDLDRGKVVSIPSRRYAVAATLARHLPLALNRRLSRQVVGGRGGSRHEPQPGQPSG